jgi:photosystem II stability/assembly factor-like uncharacterized protein
VRTACTLAVLAFFCGLAATAQFTARHNQWEVQAHGRDTNLRGVSALRVAGTKNFAIWASGSNGTILLSTDSGKTWKSLSVPGGEAFDFRGIVGFDSRTAYAMSSGEGAASRIYKTTDGGLTWKQQYAGDRKEIFLDALACISDTHCFALSDPVDGKFLLLSTADGDKWQPVPRDNMPAATAGEGAFAASGSCLTIWNQRDIYFATGGGPAARVFHSKDFGATWNVSETPIASGNASSGIFSIARRGNNVVVAGGDYKNPGSSDRVAAYSLDDGATWQLTKWQPRGYRSAVAFADDDSYLAVGPSGGDLTSDNGWHWTNMGQLDFNAESFADSANVWAVGAKGLIARSEFYVIR